MAACSENRPWRVGGTISTVRKLRYYNVPRALVVEDYSVAEIVASAKTITEAILGNLGCRALQRRGLRIRMAKILNSSV